MTALSTEYKKCAEQLQRELGNDTQNLMHLSTDIVTGIVQKIVEAPTGAAKTKALDILENFYRVYQTVHGLNVGTDSNMEKAHRIISQHFQI